MHHHQPRPGVGRHARDAGLALQAPYIVDDMGAGRHGKPGGLLTIGVDRNQHAAGGESLDDRQDTVLLLRWRHGCAARARRFSADIDDRGAFFGHASRPGQRGIDFSVAPAIRKTVRRDVQHAHDPRLGPEFERASVSELPDIRFEHLRFRGNALDAF